jgi:hypothetical protein
MASARLVEDMDWARPCFLGFGTHIVHTHPSVGHPPTFTIPVDEALAPACMKKTIL